MTQTRRPPQFHWVHLNLIYFTTNLFHPPSLEDTLAYHCYTDSIIISYFTLFLSVTPSSFSFPPRNWQSNMFSCTQLFLWHTPSFYLPLFFQSWRHFFLFFPFVRNRIFCNQFFISFILILSLFAQHSNSTRAQHIHSFILSHSLWRCYNLSTWETVFVLQQDTLLAFL